MPFPNEHACSLRTDVNVIGSRERIAKDGKKYRILFGVPKGGNASVELSYRYSKDIWSSIEAKAHCRAYGGKFEAALVKEATNRLKQAARKK